MKLILPAAIEKKLHTYVSEVPGEIAGMGAIEVRDDGNMWVTDIAIYEQKVTGGTADLSPEALAKFQTELIKEGKSPKNWYLWWHSHATMAAFFSGTDTGTIDSSSEFDHVVSLVVNKSRQRLCRFDTHRINGIPIRTTTLNVTVEVQTEVNPDAVQIDNFIESLMEEVRLARARKTQLATGLSEEEVATIKEEIEQKVTQKVWERPVGFNQGHHHGKQDKDLSFLDQPYDESWPKKRKKGGTVTTSLDGLDAGELDEHEVLLNIETLQTMIANHEAHGNGDTQECEELRDELDGWYRAIARQLDEDAIRVYLADGDKDDREWDMFWDGKQYVPRSAQDLDDLGMPRLLAPYQSSDLTDD